MPLSVTSVHPYFAISAVLLVVGWAISRKSLFYLRLLDAEVASERFHPIDGLRGFLALGVFFHHAVVSYFFYTQGHWDLPPSQFYTLLGQVGVALFFMITAFLFWNKGLQARQFLNAPRMFWSRLCRLAPMYLFSVACVFAVAIVVTDFEVRQTIKTLALESLKWISFGFATPDELNGLSQSWIINGGVQWTLKYEWLFYLFLPFGVIFVRGVGFLLLATVSAVFMAGFATNPWLWNFLFGAFAAVLAAEYHLLPARIWNTVPVALLVIGVFALVFAMFDGAYGLPQAALLFCAFICIANGNDLFGILTCRAARMLGALSYSIYLMHAIVLFVALRIVNRFVPISTVSPMNYWTIIAACGVILVLICSITYRLVEHPFMKVPMPRWLGGNRSGEPPAAETVDACLRKAD